MLTDTLAELAWAAILNSLLHADHISQCADHNITVCHVKTTCLSFRAVSCVSYSCDLFDTVNSAHLNKTTTVTSFDLHFRIDCWIHNRISSSLSIWSCWFIRLFYWHIYMIFIKKEINVLNLSKFLIWTYYTKKIN